MPVHRRDFLKILGASGVAACRPGDTDTDTSPGTIDTIVLTMMENRSFDHMFGSLLLEEGRADVEGLTADMSNPGPHGDVFVEAGEGLCIDPDPPHGWNSSRVALASGTNRGFVEAYVDSYGSDFDFAQVMRYQQRIHVPISYTIADNYALANRWFSSLAGPTWPNRLYGHGAQSQGTTSNQLPDGQFYSMRTIWDQLDEAGIEWGYYFTDLPMLALFGRFNTRLKRIDDFFNEAAAGTLPRVCMVEAGASFNDDHPPHHPMLGQVFLGSIHNALATSPQWSRCMWALTYDEAGGFFDHVAPGKAADDLAAQGFDQLGFRVPAWVAGPWTKKGVAISTELDHSSWLKHIQNVHELPNLTARDAAANDLSDFIDFDRLARNEPAEPAVLPVIPLSQDEILAQCEARSRMVSGQPELQAFVQATAPELDRTGDLVEIGRYLFEKAVELGVVVPK